VKVKVIWVTGPVWDQEQVPGGFIPKAKIIGITDQKSWRIIEKLINVRYIIIFVATKSIENFVNNLHSKQ